MTVHMIRIHCGPQASWPQADANAAVEDWMSKQSEWTADPTEHSLRSEVDPVSGLAWWRGDYRLTFESEPKDNILQKLEDKLVNKCEWYRVGYHICDHNETGDRECPEGSPADPWDEQREWADKDVTIPGEVETFV